MKAQMKLIQIALLLLLLGFGVNPASAQALLGMKK
jgi:hypothetical protein